MRFPKQLSRQDNCQNHHDNLNAREVSFQFQSKARELPPTSFEFHPQFDQFGKKYASHLELMSEHDLSHQAHQSVHHDSLLLFQDSELANLYNFVGLNRKFAYDAGSS